MFTNRFVALRLAAGLVAVLLAFGSVSAVRAGQALTDAPAKSALLAVQDGAGAAPSGGETKPVQGAKPMTLAREIRAESSRVKAMFPSWAHDGEFLTLAPWQWIGLGLLLIVAFALDRLFRVILRVIVARLGSLKSVHVSPETVTRLVRPLGILLGAVVVLLGLLALDLPDDARHALRTGARVVATLAVVVAFLRLADLLAERARGMAAQFHTSSNTLLIALVTKAVKFGIIAVGAVYVADSLHIEVLPLLTGLGIGGLAVAFAAKDTVENFFGSISVIVDRPFDVGDVVRIGDVQGTVESVGMRSTLIRTPADSIVTVPNATLVRANVDNLSRRRFQRLNVILPLDPLTAPEKIEAFQSAMRKIVTPHAAHASEPVLVHCFGISPGRIEMQVSVAVDPREVFVELNQRERVLMAAVKVCHAEGIRLASPVHAS